MKTVFQFPIASDLTVLLTSTQVKRIPTCYQGKIESIWEKERMDGFFDGTVFSLVRYTENKILGELVSFKAFFATVKDRELRKILGIYPLGITGRTFYKDKILIGTRGQNVSLYPGERECVPSGSIDRLFIRKDKSINLECGITTELSEETGIDTEFVDRIMPRSLYWDSMSYVFDIHIDIYLNEKTPIDGLQSVQNEYDEFLWVGKNEVSLPLLESCLPLSRTLLQLD